MGDRGNIIIGTPDNPEIYLYTHDSGSVLTHMLRDALRRGRERWGNSGYLTRIIFCEMVRGRAEDLTGFGISTRMLDNDRPLLFVDCTSKSVVVTHSKLPTKSLLFSEYIELPDFYCSLVAWDMVLPGYANYLLEGMMEQQRQDDLLKERMKNHPPIPPVLDIDGPPF